MRKKLSLASSFRTCMGTSYGSAITTSLIRDYIVWPYCMADKEAIPKVLFFRLITVITYP